jgi:hypothetical protein
MYCLYTKIYSHSKKQTKSLLFHIHLPKQLNVSHKNGKHFKSLKVHMATQQESAITVVTHDEDLWQCIKPMKLMALTKTAASYRVLH